MQYSIKRRDNNTPARIVDILELHAACAELSENGLHPLDVVKVIAVPAIADTLPAPAPFPSVAPAAPVNSTWTHQVTDETARVRIEAQHAALRAAGVQVNAKEQLYATGTRMADVGYSTQTDRKAEHDAKASARDAGAALVAMVESEKRTDRTVSAREVADALTSNGKISVFGHALSVQAIRGIMARTESPALGYVLGVQERCAARVAAANVGRADTAATKAANHADIAKLAEVIRHECLNASGETLKLRMREVGRGGRPDVYAVVSDGYVDADANRAVPQLVAQLPADARASYAYDVASTAWELRLSVWTPTPVAQQAVGEAFEGYVSINSRDNGTSRFRGGGGVTLVRCLNASTYAANESSVARIHRGRILYDIECLMRGGLRSIDTLTRAWGTNRENVIAVPAEHEGKRVTLEDAIPGFYMYMLRSKQSELVGVLPGRTRDHAAGLAKAFHAERRDENRLVRSDLAQGWTRYIQGQPSDVRRDGEQAIGAWLVNGNPVQCDLG